MPVFDFSQTPKGEEKRICTYETVYETSNESSVEHPILVIDNQSQQWKHHSGGVFLNQDQETAFLFEMEEGSEKAKLLKVDSRFISLIGWLGKNRIHVRLSGRNTPEGYVVYRIHETLFTGANKLSGQDGFLQYMIGRLLESGPVTQEVTSEDEEPEGDDMKLTSLQSITDFLSCAGPTLPENIRLWARRNLAVARSSEVSQEERRHAQHALSVMLGVHWMGNFFEPIDVKEARRILDEELYGMERVKQRVMETVIQINRTHTLPAYGLLLAGPAGVGKSQVALSVARILRLPWMNLDMSSIRDPEQLTGSSRVYANAKPGIIMEAFAAAGQSNLVFIINELDKATSGGGMGNPADVLLTLLDNLGFTDNYVECTIPTFGVYPIATANEKDKISAPLLSRFAVIDIEDYCDEEKVEILESFVLPKVLKRIGLAPQECTLTREGARAVVELQRGTTGIRGIEQSAEHLAANALYQIEVEGVPGVVFGQENVRALLGGRKEPDKA